MQNNIELNVVTGGDSENSGIEHGARIVEFVETFMSRDDSLLDQARKQLIHAIGEEATIEVIAVAANFQRMVRIADGTGIPLDAQMSSASEDLRASLGINNYERT